MSVYLVMPVAPAIFFGIVNKRINFQGAVASAITGILFASLFVTDQLMTSRGARLFPFLHWKLTLNYTYRGLWGSLITIAVLFIVSYLTRAPIRFRSKGSR